MERIGKIPSKLLVPIPSEDDIKYYYYIIAKTKELVNLFLNCESRIVKRYNH